MKFLDFTFFSSALILSSLVSRGAFPRDNLPAGEHPRLWWNDERLQNVHEARALETPDWIEFRSEAEEFLTGLPWNGAQYALPHLALMYRLTGDEVYATRAIQLMRDVPHPSEQGDVSKSHIGYFALAYDWLYHHPGITPAIRSELVAKAITWSDWVWQEESGSGLEGNGQDTDFVIGTGVSHLMLGCAFHGDTPRALDMLDRAWWMWERGLGNQNDERQQWTRAQPIRQWVKNAIGGHFYVGLLYFSNNESYMLAWYWETLRSACNYEITTEEPELAGFWGNCLRTIIDLTDPPRQHLYHTSDWQDSNAIDTVGYFTRALVYLIDQASGEGSVDMAAYGRSYREQVTEGGVADTFAGVFLATPLPLPSIPTRRS
jgi:hypothetical protein